MEDTDHLDGGVNVFNGQNSVLWDNVRDAFPAEITQMYQRLRSDGTLSYPTVKARFEDHQAKWPEAIFNEDSYFKYITPLTQPDPGKEPTAVYLPMAQGSKAEQRKWWLYNRFRYLDSKWNAGDALSDVIQLRGYAKSNVVVTPYADIYPAVKYGSYYVSERGWHGIPTTLVCPLSSVNDTEIIVYSASQIEDVGDLSGLKVGFADFSKATKLKAIKVGSGESGYYNPNLTELHVGTNALLKSVDARNCTTLGGTVDLGGASGLATALFDGTAVTSVSLPSGGTLRTLHLPATVANLTVRGQAGITDFTMPSYASVTTLRVESCGDAIPYRAILAQMAAGSRVRLTGFVMHVTSTQDVEGFYDLLDTMRGIDESGGNVDKAQVGGTITGLGTVDGAWMGRMMERYPTVTIGYEHINSVLTYKTYDGTTTLYTETIADGGDGTYGGVGPARESTAQYDFTFAGWSTVADDDSSDPMATRNVVGDRVVYAAYVRTVRTYTVTWKNVGNVTLETDYGVPYGTMPEYDGITPTHDGQTAYGWTPNVDVVTEDVTYTASYVPTYQITWNDSDGTLLTKTTVREGTVPTYPGTTPSREPMPFHGWYPTPVAASANATYTAVYMSSSKTVQYLDGTIESCVVDVASVRGKAFSKRSKLTSVTTSASSIGSYAFSECASLRTVDLTYQGAVHIDFHAFDNCRMLDSVIIRGGTPSTDTVYLGSTKIGIGYGAVYVPANLVDLYKASEAWSAYVILPIESYPASDYSTITDTWDEIIAAANDGTAAQKYSVGDTKKLDLGEDGVVYAQVVAKNADALADGSGNAALTFITKQLLAVPHAMSESGTTEGVWADSDMRAHLADTVSAEMPASLMAAVKEVRKYTCSNQWAPAVRDVVSTEKLWIPSNREVLDGTVFETEGPTYAAVFGSSSSRIKRLADGGMTALSWWLRTGANGVQYRYIRYDGDYYNANESSVMYLAIGFCL